MLDINVSCLCHVHTSHTHTWTYRHAHTYMLMLPHEKAPSWWGALSSACMKPTCPKKVLSTSTSFRRPMHEDVLISSRNTCMRHVRQDRHLNEQPRCSYAFSAQCIVWWFIDNSSCKYSVKRYISTCMCVHMSSIGNCPQSLTGKS